MKILMLGWEFPPHISGGLGTACFGITQGLAAHGVEVLFVVPRATGEEPRAHLELIGANEVTISKASWREGPGTSWSAASSTGQEQGAEPVSEDPNAHVFSPLFELLAIDSPLRPYMTAASYAKGVVAGDGTDATPSLEQLRSVLFGGSAAVGIQIDEVDAALATAVAAAGVQRFSFTGGYGHDLMDEVARYAVVVAEVARRNQFDVVHAHDWLTIPAGIVAARLCGKPLVVHIHACEFDRSGDHPNPQVRDVEQLGLDAADRVICVSHYTANLLARRYVVAPDKLRVVHNAVRRDQQTHDWRVEKTIAEPIVLFLGRVTFQKGPDYFLEAAARVVKIEPKVKFVMSGSGDLLPSIIEHAARLGLARNVHFTGFLRGNDVERMYAMADIYVMPSVSEPFGISPLEALAFDVPVIVSRQSGVAEILKNSLQIDFWDVADLANKILALLRYPPLRTQVVEDGREEIRRLRWDVQGGIVNDIYQELVL